MAGACNKNGTVFADNYLFTASRGPLGLQAYTAGG
jgi:hypothetical protein